MTDEYDERKLKPYEPIPEFKSREEEAEFWDTHDLADYWDEFKTVKVRFAKNLSEGLNIRLDRETLLKLREIAHAKGVGPTTLARMWLLERLAETPASKAPHSKTSAERIPSPSGRRSG
jgi:predicted DNA binding CopG/RHH family protein